MADFLAELVKTYGPIVVIGPIVLFGVAIWLLAHVSASPDSEVSVLWGMVKYTKKSSNGRPVLHKLEAEGVPTKHPATPLPAVAPSPPPVTAPPSVRKAVKGTGDLRAGLRERARVEPSTHPFDTLGEAKEGIAQLRTSRGVRQITAAESGRHMKEIAELTYFFTLVNWLNSGTAGGFEKYVEKLLGLEAQRFQDSTFPAEVHKLSTGLELIGFMDETNAARITRLDGTAECDAEMALEWRESTPVLVSVPVIRVANARVRDAAIAVGKKVKVIDLRLR